MKKNVLIDDKQTLLTKTKVQFGALNSPTPNWAKWMFRSVAILTTVLAFYVAGTQLIAEQWKVEVMLGLKSIDMLTLGFSKMFGIVEK
jgi:hypothetical protein